MKETVEQIRGLLDKLEGEADTAEETATMRVLSGLELPDLMRDVVDLLMPDLGPYETSFYLYFLRHSIIETGKPYLRAGTRPLQSAVVRSTYADNKGGRNSGSVSLQKVRATLQNLEALGAIRREGEANRDGTLYHVMLPEGLRRASADAKNLGPRQPSSRPKRAKPTITTCAKTDRRSTSVTRTSASIAASS